MTPSLILAVFLCFASLAFAEAAQPAPFTDADILEISRGFSTVGDFVSALSPTSYSWAYEGEATGVTYLTLHTDGADGQALGEATVALILNGGAIYGEPDGEGPSLPAELNDAKAWLVGARWLSAGYALPAIRGIIPGASDRDVVSAFFSHSATEPSYAAQDINPAVDKSWLIPDGAHIGGSRLEREDGGWDEMYGWCTLDEPDEWREYDLLVYHIQGDVVQSVELSYSTDPE